MNENKPVECPTCQGDGTVTGACGDCPSCGGTGTITIKPIPDGPPISMDQFRLGPYYGSEDMYRDMGIKPGDRVGVDIGGVVYVDTVKDIRHTGPQWTPPPELPWWRRALRTITPRRFRRPLPAGTSRPANITIDVGTNTDTLARAAQHIGAVGTLIDGLISVKPQEPHHD